MKLFSATLNLGDVLQLLTLVVGAVWLFATLTGRVDNLTAMYGDLKSQVGEVNQRLAELGR